MLWMLAALALAEPLAGEVVDPSGQPVANATVLIATYRESQEVQRLSTDTRGRWKADVPRGSYSIRAGSPGFGIAQRPVFVAPADGASLRQTLPEASQMQMQGTTPE